MSDEPEGNPEMIVKCSCGCVFSLHYHTVCPRCFQWPNWIGEQEKPNPRGT